MKKELIPLLIIPLAGCGSLVAQNPPNGCTPLPTTTGTNQSPGKSTETPQRYASTLLKLENNRYTYPIPQLTQVESFTENLKKSAATQGFSITADTQKILQLATHGKSDATSQAIVSNAAKMSSLSGIGVTTTLISIEQMLDDLLNRTNSMLSSQLFAMRSHVAATVSDLNVVLKGQMQDAYDKLNEQQRQALDRAMLLATEAQAALDKLAKEGAFAASDLLCQSTVNFANYPNTLVGLGLPFERCFAPDILCISSIEVRDVGTSQAEQMLQFRGVNLIPNDEYANATLLVSGKEIKLPTAGGKSVLQLPLPGGLNGKIGDTTQRGPLMARVDFEWPKNNVNRKWFFELKPYQVRSIEVTFGFEIEGPVRTIREQPCHVSAEGGSIGAREEFATCTILPDSTDKSIEKCEEGTTTSQNGDAEIRNRQFSVGACSWELRAKSKPWYGAGAWLDFIGRAHQISKQRINGPAYVSNKTLNQSEKTWVIDYPEEFTPPEYKIIDGRHRYNVIITDNEGNRITLTEAKPTDPKFGSAIVVGKRLTITLP